MVRGEIYRVVPETVTLDDIVGVKLSSTSGFLEWEYDDDFRRYIDLKTGTYANNRHCNGNTKSRDSNTDQVDAIRKIIADSGILDAEEDSGLEIYDAGDDYITLFTETDEYVLCSSMSVGPSFGIVWYGIKDIIALDDPSIYTDIERLIRKLNEL